MIHFNYDLTALNTLKLAATAQAYAQFSSADELIDHIQWARSQNLPVKVLGGGSNVLMNGHIPALVVQSSMAEITELLPDERGARVSVDSGVVWHDWVQQSIKYGHGLENLALIPGTVGAAPVQNIGAYGVEVASFIEWVEGVQLSTCKLVQVRAEHCAFSYRDSIFKQALADDFVITRVLFRLSYEFKPNLSYGPLQALDINTLTAEQLIESICTIRNSKLPNPVLIPNAGSFFKNPLVSAELAQELAISYPQMPFYPQQNGQTKLAAGWLIEQSGFKGVWQGNVRMHDKQALVLTTNGKASFAEVVALYEAVMSEVKQRFGVELEPEPQVF